LRPELLLVHATPPPDFAGVEDAVEDFHLVRTFPKERGCALTVGLGPPVPRYTNGIFLTDSHSNASWPGRTAQEYAKPWRQCHYPQAGRKDYAKPRVAR